MFRTDLWVSAFVRRHNDIGHLCVVSRRGDPIAGQIFVEVDHLNGEVSLYTPAPATSLAEELADEPGGEIAAAGVCFMCVLQALRETIKA